MAKKTTSVKKANRTVTARKPSAKRPARRAAAGKKAASPKHKPVAAGSAKSAQGPRPLKMSPRDKAELREKLFALRERLTGQIASLKSESLTRSDSVYSMEDGTDAFDRQFGLSLANSENEALHDVDEALRRLEEGAYGVCDECSGLIEGPRLKALPFVRTCISCQSEIEKKRGSILPILPTE